MILSFNEVSTSIGKSLISIQLIKENRKNVESILSTLDANKLYDFETIQKNNTEKLAQLLFTVGPLLAQKRRDFPLPLSDKEETEKKQLLNFLTLILQNKKLPLNFNQEINDEHYEGTLFQLIMITLLNVDKDEELEKNYVSEQLQLVLDKIHNSLNQPYQLLFNPIASKLLIDAVLSKQLTETMAIELLEKSKDFQLYGEFTPEGSNKKNKICFLLDFYPQDPSAVHHYPSTIFFKALLKAYGKKISPKSPVNTIKGQTIGLLFNLNNERANYSEAKSDNMSKEFDDWLEKEKIRQRILKHNKKFITKSTFTEKSNALNIKLQHKEILLLKLEALFGKTSFKIKKLNSPDIIDLTQSSISETEIISIELETYASKITESTIEKVCLLIESNRFTKISVDTTKSTITGPLNQVATLLSNGKLIQEPNKKAKAESLNPEQQEKPISLNPEQQERWIAFIKTYSCQFQELQIKWNSEQQQFDITLFDDKTVTLSPPKSRQPAVFENENAKKLKDKWADFFRKYLKSENIGKLIKQKLENGITYTVKPYQDEPPILDLKQNLFATAVADAHQLMLKTPENVTFSGNQTPHTPVNEVDNKNNTTEENESVTLEPINEWFIELINTLTGNKYNSKNQQLFIISLSNLNEIEFIFKAKLLLVKGTSVKTADICKIMYEAFAECHPKMKIKLQENKLCISHNLLDLDQQSIIDAANEKMNLFLQDLASQQPTHQELPIEEFTVMIKQNKKSTVTEKKPTFIFNLPVDEMTIFSKVLCNLLNFQNNRPQKINAQKKYCETIHTFFCYLGLSSDKATLKKIIYSFSDEQFNQFYELANPLISELKKVSKAINKKHKPDADFNISITTSLSIDEWKKLHKEFSNCITQEISKLIISSTVFQPTVFPLTRKETVEPFWTMDRSR